MFFGGARGGGKTDGVLGKWAIKAARYGAAFNAMMFRKTTVASEDAIARSKDLFAHIGGVFANGAWRMPGGGRIGFCYLDSVRDADAWQGRNLTDVWIEEAGLYASPDVIWRLFGVLLSAAGVSTQMILTGNPGGPGQHWISGRYELHPFPRDTRNLPWIHKDPTSPGWTWSVNTKPGCLDIIGDPLNGTTPSAVTRRDSSSYCSASP